MNQRGNPLRVFGVGKALEEAVRGAQDRKGHFGSVDDGGEALVMAFAGLAEEHALNAATGTQSFFDKSDALDAHEAAFRGQSATQSYSELLEPAIVAAGKERRRTLGAGVTRGCSRRGRLRGEEQISTSQ